MLQSGPFAISDLFSTAANAKQTSLRMGQRSTAQNTLYQQKAQPETWQCLGRAQPESGESAKHSWCKVPRVQRWTTRPCREGGRASWATDLGGFSTHHLSFCRAQGDDALWTFQKSIRIAPSAIQVLVPPRSLPISSQEQFALFLEVILKQSGVAFFSLCWHCAAVRLSSTREAGKLCT